MKVKDKDRERLGAIEDSWTRCVRALKEFRGAWERHRNLVWAYREMGVPLDMLPERLQKDLAQPFSSSPFEKALPQLTSYYRRAGGIEFLYEKPIDTAPGKALERLRKKKEEAKVEDDTKDK